MAGTAGYQVSYYARLKNTSGIQTAIFTSYDKFEFKNIVNDVGYHALTFTDDGSAEKQAFFDLFTTDSQLEIYRKVVGEDFTVDWYVEHEGLIRKKNDKISSSGKQEIVVTGFSYNHLLTRRVIAYLGGTIRADKNAAADSVMAEYVLENCGENATAALGRKFAPEPGIPTYVDVDGVMPGFSVNIPVGVANNWSGSRPYENLLDVLQEISEYSGVDFAVTGNGDGQFLFTTHPNQLGKNRTREGITPGSHLNMYGNAPVVFSTEFGNVTEFEHIYDRSKEGNVCLVLGQGELSTRAVLPVFDQDNRTYTPWNQHEVSRPGSNQEFVYQMQNFGEEVLEGLKYVESFSFQPLQQPPSIYGKDYTLGDRIIISHKGEEKNYRIVGVQIKVDAGKETISLDFEE